MLKRASVLFFLGLILLSVMIDQCFKKILMPGSKWWSLISDFRTVKFLELPRDFYLIDKNLSIEQEKYRKIFNLTRLAEEKYLPVLIKSEISRKGRLSYWAWSDSEQKVSKAIVIGQNGIIGRAENRSTGFYKLYPIAHKDFQIAVIHEKLTKPILLKGNGDYFLGEDPLNEVNAGDILFTLSCDPNYPRNYPVATVVNKKVQNQKVLIQANPIEVFGTTHLGLLYVN